MRYLGIDYGERRIGMAMADEEMMTAVPRGVIVREDDTQAVRDTGSVVAREKIEKIIVGLPIGLNGAETEMSAAARAFGDKLGVAAGLLVEFENEVFTTRMAIHEGVRKGDRDAASAAIILQSYLDKQQATSDKGR